MRLDELKWQPGTAIWPRWARPTRLVWIFQGRDGRYLIEKSRGWLASEKERRWEDLDALTAQAVLIELTSGGKDAAR